MPRLIATSAMRRAVWLITTAARERQWGTLIVLCLNIRTLLTVQRRPGPQPDRPADPFTYTLR